MRQSGCGGEKSPAEQTDTMGGTVVSRAGDPRAQRRTAVRKLGRRGRGSRTVLSLQSGTQRSDDKWISV